LLLLGGSGRRIFCWAGSLTVTGKEPATCTLSTGEEKKEGSKLLRLKLPDSSSPPSLSLASSGTSTLGGSSTLKASELNGERVLAGSLLRAGLAKMYCTFSSFSPSGMKPVRSGALSCWKGSVLLLARSTDSRNPGLKVDVVKGRGSRGELWTLRGLARGESKYWISRLFNPPEGSTLFAAALASAAELSLIPVTSL